MFKIHHEGSGSIFYATQDSAGFDFCANESVVIAPGQRALIGTGVRIIESLSPEPQNQIRLIPELQIRPRSGLALKHGVTVLNSPSTIDADYRGEIKVILINHGTEDFIVTPGDRIAQGVCNIVFQAPSIKVNQEVRGEGGFGSTGAR